MDILQAILLGIVEGFTEFLPISSTGHLIVAQELIGYRDASRMFTVVIQMGAMAAVVWFYRHDLWSLITGLIRGNTKARRFWLIWVIATVPAGIVGLIVEPSLEIYATIITVALALILGGVAIWLIETYAHKAPISKKGDQLDKLTPRQALYIGLYQVLALIPGVSRSGATIMGGLLSGVDRVTATAFSFYLGIPVLFMAGVYKLFTDDVSTIEGSTLALVAGTVASFLTSLVVIGWLLRYVSKHSFKVFAYYRVALGAVLLLLLATGVIA